MFEELVGNYFLNVANPFLCCGVTIAIFQIYGIISYSVHFSKDLLIAFIKLSFDDKYFNISGCISSGLILLLTPNLDNNSFMTLALIRSSIIFVPSVLIVSLSVFLLPST